MIALLNLSKEIGDIKSNALPNEYYKMSQPLMDYTILHKIKISQEVL
jgi:hypothetical protein